MKSLITSRLAAGDGGVEHEEVAMGSAGKSVDARPPKRLSTPSPPISLSFPASPDSTSLPPAPLIVSLPVSPTSRSLPSRPLIVSLPPKPERKSALLPPRKVSLPASAVLISAKSSSTEAVRATATIFRAGILMPSTLTSRVDPCRKE